jgi:hypothetical protein
MAIQVKPNNKKPELWPAPVKEICSMGFPQYAEVFLFFHTLKWMGANSEGLTTCHVCSISHS